jgi:hypothetical protein
VLLVTVHHVGGLKLAEHTDAERIGPLPSNEPWTSDDANPQRSDPFLAIHVPEADERRRYDGGHAASELQGVALRAADHAAWPEQRRNDMSDPHPT